MGTLREIIEEERDPLLGMHVDKSILSKDRWVSFESDKLRGRVGSKVVDYRTKQVLEIDKLYQALRHTITHFGSAVLYRTLNQPHTSLDIIVAKQESVKELEADDRLRNGISDLLTEFRSVETAIFDFVDGYEPIADSSDPTGLFPRFRETKKAFEAIKKAAQSIPNPETPYLRYLVDSVLGATESQTHELIEGPLHRTLSGIKTRQQKEWYEPSLRFRPVPINWVEAAMAAPFAGMMGAFGMGIIESGSIGMLPWVGLGLTVASVFYGFGFKEGFDKNSAVFPLREFALSNPEFILGIEGIGRMDELMSFVEYGKSFPADTSVVLPTMTDYDRHHFRATDLKNPIEAQRNPGYVGNNIHLDGCGITFITGRNSGGKTNTCLTVEQSQLLAQMGCYIAATTAEINIADQIHYQAQQFGSQQNREGMFGVQLEDSMRIFYKVTPRSLVVLEGLAEGTTDEERKAISGYILNGFHTIGNNTMMVTHDHETVSSFRASGIGQYLMVEIDSDGSPTFGLIEGISTFSNAQRVAKKLGFSADDIDANLRERGYR